MDKQTHDFVLESSISAENNQEIQQQQKEETNIFYLKKKCESCEEDFVHEYFAYEKRKAEIILAWGLSLERLHELGEYKDSKDTISEFIKQRLRARGVTEGAIGYVSVILPSRLKNENLNRYDDSENGREKTREVFDDEEDFENVELSKTTQKNLYTLRKKLAEYSPAELQDYYRQIKIKDRENRIRAKARRDLVIQVSMERKIGLPEYKKISKEIPSEQLHGISKLYNVMGLIIKDHIDIVKHLTDIHKSIYEFKPTDELSERLGDNLLLTRNTFIKTYKSLFVPYSDDKWSQDHYDWMDTQLQYLWQSKNAAGVKAAIPTGEMVIRTKNGKNIIVPLDRGLTREQVGDKLPEMIEFCQDVILSYPIVKEIKEWSQKTYIVDSGREQ